MMLCKNVEKGLLILTIFDRSIHLMTIHIHFFEYTYCLSAIIKKKIANTLIRW